jgi:DNA-directed RNA polymerase specialized sigma24 family protein
VDIFRKQAPLSEVAFDKLLGALGKDRDSAGQQYERIRRKLVRYFESHGCLCPDDQADEVIDRVAAKISEGVEIYADDPAIYFYGVARYVLKEYWDKRPRATEPLSENLSLPSLSANPDELQREDDSRMQTERDMDCLEGCLGALPDDKRELITSYYQGDTAQKIANRKALAARLGTPINALRSRALRVRETLEACLHNCLAQAQPAAT